MGRSPLTDLNALQRRLDATIHERDQERGRAARLDRQVTRLGGELARMDQALTAAEIRCQVLDGTACAEEQAIGNGPCGACVNCLRAERDEARQELAQLKEDINAAE